MFDIQTRRMIMTDKEERTVMEYRTAIGQDSHRFEETSASVESGKPLVLAGVRIPGIEGLAGNSDADVVFHALTNAISGISCVNILGAVADEMCLDRSIRDSGEYVSAALKTLGPYEIVHLSFSIECKRPRITPFIDAMRLNLSGRMNLPCDSIGITATSGEGLTDFGRGLGIQVFCIITARRDLP